MSAAPSDHAAFTFNPGAPLVDAVDRANIPANQRPYDPDRPLQNLDIHWRDLVMPYHFHAWLMYLFIEAARDHQHLRRHDPDALLHHLRDAPLALFARRIKPRDPRRARELLLSVLDVHDTIARLGFNPAKRVPVARNAAARVVPLKGAKRIAACIALRRHHVPATLYAPIPKRFAPDKRERCCRDYTALIRDHLADHPEVRAALTAFDIPHPTP